MVATSALVETCEQEITSLRRCFFEGPDGLKLGSSRLPPVIDKLRILVAYGEDRSKKTLGQALYLSSLLSCHRMDYGTCLQQTRETIEHAYEMNDVDMMVAALIQQGMLSYYEFRPRPRHYAFHRAMQLLDKVESPLIHARVLYGYAESLAASGGQDAEDLRRMSAEGYLERTESLLISDDDPGHAYVRWNHVTRAIHRARFLVAQSQLREAVELLTPLYSGDSIPDNAEVLFLLAEAHSHMISLRQGADDTFERACFFIEALVDSATRMGSLVHHSQAQVCYEFLMQSKWHRQVLKRLGPLVCF